MHYLAMVTPGYDPWVGYGTDLAGQLERVPRRHAADPGPE